MPESYKKVLIITYYWPPAAGAGVFRVLKFVKYLPHFGWKPVILTVKNGAFPARDPSLTTEVPDICRVYTSRNFEPANLYKKVVGMDQEDRIPSAVLTQENLSWRKKLTHWIRLNLFLPDAKIGWIPFGVHRGRQIIAAEQPDLIFSTSPPPTTHLVGKFLKGISGLPWVADFRDPWTNVYYYDQLPRSPISQKIDRSLEKSVVQRCDKTVVVNNGFFDYDSAGIHPVRIPNGFDRDDIPELPESVNNRKFTLRYFGTMKSRQYVESLFDVLKDLGETEKYRDSIRVEIIGPVESEALEKIRKKNIALELQFTGYMNHPEGLQRIAEADLLVFVIGKSSQAEVILSSKIFEYLMVRRPILGIGPPEGDASELLLRTGAGKMFDYRDQSGIRTFCINQFEKWEDGEVEVSIDTDEIEKYSRYSLTKKLTKVFEELA